jgi:hypothetical protein
MTEIEYSLRPAIGADAPKVAALVNTAYGHYVEHIGIMPRPMTDDYAQLIANQRVTVVESHATIVGNLRDAALRGRAVAHLAGDPEVARWNGCSLSSGGLAKVYGFTDLDGSQPEAWRYLTEVQDPGRPANATGYR